jgi:hypothetical protein
MTSNIINTITTVTAFFDINRENWSTFNRSVDFYIQSFERKSLLVDCPNQYSYENIDWK